MRARSESSLLRNGNWRLLWLGQSVSATGDMVFTMTVLLWIATIIAKGQAWAPAAASGALIATAAPVLARWPASSWTAGTGAGRCSSPTRPAAR